MKGDVTFDFGMKDKEALDDIVRCIGSLTYGKERWFRSYAWGDIWYDREKGEYLNTEEMVENVCKALKESIED